ncbi:MAG: M1 family peptidase, partial [Bdellovibrionales bacterium]
MRFERTCFDVLRYNLDIMVLPRTKKIKGNNEIVFKVVENTKKIQIDLFDNMQIDSIIWNKQKLDYKREFNAVFVSFPSELNKETTQSIQFFYQGNPVVARNAPWDGGFVFNKDKNGKDWIGVAVQGTGASLW